MAWCNLTIRLIETNVKLEKSSEYDLVYSALFKQIMGSLRYLCTSRQDIRFRLGLFSRFMDASKRPHLTAIKKDTKVFARHLRLQ